MKQMQGMHIKVEEKEMVKMEKMADSNRKISREEFVCYGKGSRAVKEWVEKAGHGHGKAGRADTVKIDKAMAAFKVGRESKEVPCTESSQAIDKDNSGFVDREEFLDFTRYCTSTAAHNSNHQILATCQSRRGRSS